MLDFDRSGRLALAVQGRIPVASAKMDSGRPELSAVQKDPNQETAGIYGRGNSNGTGTSDLV
jgi:hypothetical protein